MKNQNYTMPQFPEPYWREIELPKFNQLSEDIKVDVAIVGGGITGITTAYLLAKEGVKVALLEAGNILNGTTGHTTAKITSQHGLIYDELISHFGEDGAKLYYEATAGALNFITKTIDEKQINCDYSQEDAILYSISDQYAQKVEKEAEAYHKLGIPSSMTDSIPFNIKIKNALVMKDQGQFHPLKYLVKLVNDFVDAGGMVYENTTAVNVVEGTEPTVETRNGHKVKCNYVIAASHFPFHDAKGFYFARMEAKRSYIIGVTIKTPFPGGMYYSADQPTRSLRYTPINGEKLVLISGDGHKTGQGVDTMKHYKALEEFGAEVLGIEEYKYRWSAQDLFTLDKVPYIGEITANNPNILVATGYRKWGMTNGTAAALLLRDIVTKRENNPYKELYNPSRFKADPSIKKFISMNTDVAGHLIKGKLEMAPKDIKDLEMDEGCVVKVNGKRAGAYKDMEGCVHVVDTTCTHLGCEVEWNHGDRTWDCPCHGSRYTVEGEVVEGPATKPLKKLDAQ